MRVNTSTINSQTYDEYHTKLNANKRPNNDQDDERGIDEFTGQDERPKKLGVIGPNISLSGDTWHQCLGGYLDESKQATHEGLGTFMGVLQL